MIILNGYSECGSIENIRICKENFHGVNWIVSYNDRIYSRYKSHRSDFDVNWSIYGVTDRKPFTESNIIITLDYYINNKKPDDWSYYTQPVDEGKSLELETIFQSLLSETMRDNKLNYICKLWGKIWIKIKYLINIK
jgi:hypothetical protein